MIDERLIIDHLKNWKASLGTTFHDEIIGVVLDVILKKIESFPMIESTDKWILCDERVPETNDYVLLSFENFPLPHVGRYEADDEGGAWFIGDDDVSCCSCGIFVNAWQPLPEAYRPKEETKEDAAWKESIMAHFTKCD